jgi:hypothetical protein
VADHLNDVARPVRLLSLSTSLWAALMVTSMLLLWRDGITAVVGFLVGVVGWIATMVCQIVWTLRTNGRVLQQAVVASSEIVAGRVQPVRVPGRVVRTRPGRRRPAYVDSGQLPPGHPSRSLLANVLTDAGPRRALALVPAELPLTARDRPVALLLHPTSPGLAVLDTSIDPAALAAGDADPRWSTERLPTEGSIAGGWTAAVACALLGVAVGVLAAVVLVAAL